MSIKVSQLLTVIFLLLFSVQGLSNVVFTSTPANPSPASVPLTFSWIDDCEFITIDYGDGFSDTNPATLNNTIIHAYEIPGDYFVQLTGNVCNTPGTQDFITVFIQGGAPGPGPGPGPITPTPTQVNIERLQLYFDNNLPKTTVPRNRENLQVHAKIRYSGSGLFQAFWQVDGRIIERIDRHLLDGGTLELSTPEQFQLPTFISGPHNIQLVVTTPSLSPASLPKAVYFVTEDDALSSKPELISPINRSISSTTDRLEFRWNNISPSPRYLLEIFEGDSSEKVFSAYAKQHSYQLKKPFMESFLQPGKGYSWQVSALSEAGKITSTSEKNTLTVSEKNWVVDHQFMLIVDDSLLGHSVKQQLINEYQLDVIEEFTLNTLSQAVVVFQTERESNQLLNDLLKKNGVVGAQPDYIYRSMAAHVEALQPNNENEPLQDLQSLSRLFDFNRVHQLMSGAGSSIAVIDTGVETSHPDLFDAEIRKLNFIKNNRYQEEIHGTAVTGIIAAQKNSIGIVGIAPQVKILALRACRQLQPGVPDAECFSSSLAKALDKALTEQSQLVNLSFGTPGIDPLVSSLLVHGHEQGALFIASAGNDSRQQTLSFPASHEFVLSVAGKDGPQVFPSQLLADKADVLAPSEQVFSTVYEGRHNFLNGTSMSSAIVSGILTLAIGNSSAKDLNLKENGSNFCGWVNSILKIEACKDLQ